MNRNRTRNYENSMLVSRVTVERISDSNKKLTVKLPINKIAPYGSQSAVTLPFCKNKQPKLVPVHELALALEEAYCSTIRKKNRNKGRRKSIGFYI